MDDRRLLKKERLGCGVGAGVGGLKKKTFASSRVFDIR